MATSFEPWVLAVIRHWVGLLGGTAVSVALLVWGQYSATGRIPQRIWWMGIAGGFLASCFLAWRDEHERAESTEAELNDRQRIKQAREAIAKILEQLSFYEMKAYDGSNGDEYDVLFKQLAQIKEQVEFVASQYLDSSFASRFHAVNVYDVHLDEATRLHFIHRAQGSFWTMYQQIKGWRALLAEVLKELGGQHDRHGV